MGRLLDPVDRQRRRALLRSWMSNGIIGIGTSPADTETTLFIRLNNSGQGMDPPASGPYNTLPWRLGLLTQTNSPC